MKRLQQSGLVLFLGTIGFGTTQNLRASQELPRSMAAIGDSITAGAIANYRRTAFLNPLTLFPLLIDVASLIKSKSINAFDNRMLTWSTGQDRHLRMASHQDFLEFMGGHQMHVYNASISGSKSYDTPKQARNIVRWSNEKLGGQGVDYVTILIGGNDTCRNKIKDMTSLHRFAESVDESIRELKTHAGHTKILLSSVPNVQLLKEVAENAIVQGVGPLATCRKVWDVGGPCKTVTDVKTKEEKAAVKERLLGYNQVLADMVEDYERRFPGTMKYGKSVYKTPFEAKHLAPDCFHPNFMGQNLLSKKSFRDTWWADDFSKVAESFENDRALKKRKLRRKRLRRMRRKR